MLRSMFSGVSGLRSHQTMMDVVGNNIANVNTTGYKAARVAFQDTLSQLVKGGSAGGGAGTDTGGMNAQQIGLGVRVGAIDNVTTQGSLQSTGRTTDLAIQGDGYFMVRNAEQTLYTRAGNFNFDNQGNLVDTAGYIVQGFLADAAGKINTTGSAQNLRLPLGQSVPPRATDNITLGGNLSSNVPALKSKAGLTEADSQVSTNMQVYDTLGNAHMVTFTYTKTKENTWTVTASAPDATGMAQELMAEPVTLTFDTKGNRASFAEPRPNSFLINLPGAGGPAGGGAGTIEVNIGKPESATSIHQYAGPTSAEAYEQNGAPTGFLRSFSVGDDGIFTGIYSNGFQVALGQVAVASFSNPGSANASGLVKMGNNQWRADSNTGTPAVGVPGQLGNGSLAAGMLEMSNVDLSQEFTNLIIAQRGFQANSRIISASDELLQDVVNIKR
jgi:flagellar hook protein FlgE